MIFLILVLALILRLINLNQSLWLDEAVQAVVAQNSLAFTFEELKGDFHPPLFHLLMHFWVRIFGSSEIILRIPSVLFGVGTVFVVYLIASEIFGNKNFQFSQLSALLMTIAPFHVYYSQEARMYSMVTFFTSLSMLYFIKAIKVINIINYIFFTSLALYSDYYAFLVFLSQIIVVFVFFRKKFSKLLPSFIFVMLLFLPCVPLLKSQVKTGILATQSLPGWGKIVNVSFLKALPLTFIKFAVGRITIFDKKIYALVAGLILGVFGGLGAYGGYKNYKNHKDYKLILFWFFIPLIISWFVSLWIPNYQPFRLLLVLPAFYLILVKGVFSIQSKKLRIASTSFIFFVSAVCLFIYYKEPFFWREDWRGVAEFIKKDNLPLVVSAQAFDWPLVYYQADKVIINVASGASIVSQDNKEAFLKKINRFSIVYTPYLADIYDPASLVPEWLDQAGFVRIKEISFNQIPLWIYEK